ncbi:Hypothetical predicted protein, partial [Olea europaea subsp. europaea]
RVDSETSTTKGTTGLRREPFVNTLQVKAVVAMRQHSHCIAVKKSPEAYTALRFKVTGGPSGQVKRWQAVVERGRGRHAGRKGI